MIKSTVLASVLLVGSVIGASAQVGGSYQQSCANINQDGSMLTAECRAGNGGRYVSTIDTERCHGIGVSNNNGRLFCGNVQGTATPSGRSRDFGGQQDDGGNRRPRPRVGYDASDDGEGYVPPRRYRRPPPSPPYDDEDGVPRRRHYVDPDD